MTAPNKVFFAQPILEGKLVRLRPVVPDDWEALFAVATDPLIWEQHPVRDRYQEPIFRAFFQGALDSGGAFAVLDRATGEVIGSTRYYGYDPERSEVEIGWTFLARRHWGGRYNGEMKQLMLDHAFQFVDNVVFFIGVDNIRSRKAVEKLGAAEVERVERADEAGRIWPIAKYSITRQDWSLRMRDGIEAAKKEQV